MARGARNPGRGSRIKMKDKYQGSRIKGGRVGRGGKKENRDDKVSAG